MRRTHYLNIQGAEKFVENAFFSLKEMVVKSH